jgi:hypothetical protein
MDEAFQSEDEAARTETTPHVDRSHDMVPIAQTLLSTVDETSE